MRRSTWHVTVDLCIPVTYGQGMPTTQVAFRLDDEVVKRIDEYAKRLASKTPGIEYSRSDAARALIVRGLDAADSEADAGTPQPPAEPATAKPKARKRGA